MTNIFISYRRDDFTLAEKLAQDLSRAGHQVWFDEWTISLGDSIVEKITSGLERASYLVLCCSKSGVDSPWISREWMSSLARQLNDFSIKILPVLLSGGHVPVILSDIKYADLSSDWRKGINDLLQAIK